MNSTGRCARGNLPPAALSLAGLEAPRDCPYAAYSTRSITYNASPIVLAAAMYYVLLWPCVRLLSRLEHRNLAAR